MNPNLLIPIIDTAQTAARTLIYALELLKMRLEIPETSTEPCQHKNKIDTSTMGSSGNWFCPDCQMTHPQGESDVSIHSD